MTAVTEAVVLAAGRGRRLGALTERFPKALLQVGGRPILHRIIGGLSAAGIRSVVVVVGHEGETVERTTGDGSEWGLGIRYIRQVHLEGTARAVALAQGLIGPRAFFVGWGDIVVEPGNYARILAAARDGRGALGLNEVEDPAAGAAVYLDANGRVERIVEKPAPGTSTTRWNNAGLAVLPPAVWPFIEALEPSARGEYELPQAIEAYIAAGNALQGVPIEGPWFDIGTPESLEAARRWFGE